MVFWIFKQEKLLSCDLGQRALQEDGPGENRCCNYHYDEAFDLSLLHSHALTITVVGEVPASTWPVSPIFNVLQGPMVFNMSKIKREERFLSVCSLYLSRCNFWSILHAPQLYSDWLLN
jgi:hypothetical protein